MLLRIARMPEAAKAERNSKISTKAQEQHATMTDEMRAHRAAAISKTLMSKPPGHKQKIAAGNTMRGALKRAGLAMEHPLRCRLDKLIADTSWDGEPETKANFDRKCASVLARYL